MNTGCGAGILPAQQIAGWKPAAQFAIAQLVLTRVLSTFRRRLRRLCGCILCFAAEQQRRVQRRDAEDAENSRTTARQAAIRATSGVPASAGHPRKRHRIPSASTPANTAGVAPGVRSTAFRRVFRRRGCGRNKPPADAPSSARGAAGGRVPNTEAPARLQTPQAWHPAFVVPPSGGLCRRGCGRNKPPADAPSSARGAAGGRVPNTEALARLQTPQAWHPAFVVPPSGGSSSSWLWP